MHIYINAYYILIGIAGVSGYYLGRHTLAQKTIKQVEADINQYYFNHFNKQYNEQMDHLVAQYKQERAEMVHRHENLTLELEHEIAIIRNAVDLQRTQIKTIEQYRDRGAV